MQRQWTAVTLIMQFCFTRSLSYSIVFHFHNIPLGLGNALCMHGHTCIPGATWHTHTQRTYSRHCLPHTASWYPGMQAAYYANLETKEQHSNTEQAAVLTAVVRRFNGKDQKIDRERSRSFDLNGRSRSKSNFPDLRSRQSGWYIGRIVNREWITPSGG